MKPRLAFFIIMMLLASSLHQVRGAVTSVEVTPEDPVQGDVVEIAISASPNEEVSVRLSFTTELDVVDGEYELYLDGVDVLQTPTSITAKATGVENLRVAVKMGVWFTKSVDADDGVATVSQGGVPAGQYEGKVYGDAEEGESHVTLTVTATTTVTMDADGKYVIEYDTSAIPPGDFTAKIGSVTKEISLGSSGEGGGGGGGGEPTPVASFPDTAYVGEEVKFDGSDSYGEDCDIAEWDWEFGDGSSGSGSMAKHTYDEVGEYSVTLTVIDEFDVSASDSWEILILQRPNAPPVAKPGSDRTIYLGSVADFDGANSYDEDGAITAYTWDFGDGSFADGAKASHVYEKAGIYHVSLTVSDDDGEESSSGVIITVVQLPLEPQVNSMTELEVGKNHVVSFANSTLPLYVKLNTSSPVSLSLFQYPANPYPRVALPLNCLPYFFDVSFSNLDAVEWPIRVDIDCSGISLDEISRLGLFYYDGEEWCLCQQTGISDEGMVWALMSKAEASGSPLLIGEKASGASFRVTDFKIDSSNYYTGENVTVTISIENVGVEAGNTTLSLLIDGKTEKIMIVSLASGEQRVVSFTFTRDVAGVYSVELGGFSSDVNLVSPPRPADIILVGLEVTPLRIKEGGEISVSASFVNNGDVEGSRSVAVLVNGLASVSRIITLTGGESTVFRVSLNLNDVGKQTISVGEKSVEVEVYETATSTSNDEFYQVRMAAIVLLLLTGVIIAFFYFLRWRRLRT